MRKTISYKKVTWLLKSAYFFFLCTLNKIELLKQQLKNRQEGFSMALSNVAEFAGSASACGASDKPSACGAAAPEEKPSACGSACGASDKPEEQPSACGSACGAGDK